MNHAHIQMCGPTRVLYYARMSSVELNYSRLLEHGPHVACSMKTPTYGSQYFALSRNVNVQQNDVVGISLQVWHAAFSIIVGIAVCHRS